VLAAQEQFDAAIPHLERALAIRPDDVEAHRSLGQIYAMRHDDARALPHLMRAADAMDDPALVTRIAAMLAGSGDPMVRDPRRALGFAERAVALTGRRDPVALDILAATLAGLGRFAEAAAAAGEAVPLAAAQGNQPLVAELQQRARTYSQQRR
jgi:Flp pilus assembly protein TadD